MPALEIICLASALVAVSITTGEAIHGIVIIWTELIRAVTVLRKITGVDGLSTWCSSNLELKKKNKPKNKDNKTTPRTQKYHWIFFWILGFGTNLTVVTASPLGTSRSACKFASGSVTALVVAFLHRMKRQERNANQV